MCVGCGKQHFWETTFEITSPHYPDNYEHNIRCSYYIHNPLNSLITITFEAFALEFDDDCDYDSLSVSIQIKSNQFIYKPAQVTKKQYKTT